jgi:amino acid transporter
VLLNLAYFHALGVAGGAASHAVAAATLGRVLGPAEDGLFPARLAAVSPRTLTPVNAIAMTAAFSIILVTLGGYAFLIRLHVLGFYPLVAVALFAAVRLRRRDGPPRDFAMPLYPLPLLVYGVGIVGICVASAVGDPVGAAFGLSAKKTQCVAKAVMAPAGCLIVRPCRSRPDEGPAGGGRSAPPSHSF